MNRQVVSDGESERDDIKTEKVHLAPPAGETQTGQVIRPLSDSVSDSKACFILLRHSYGVATQAT